MSSQVYELIDTTGVIVPDAAVIQTEVQTEYTNAFGTDLNVTAPNTPQGLLINAETLARIAAANNNATLANQINPNFAGGVFLDAIMDLTGNQRIPATYTQVDAIITGVAGTVIPDGSQASSNANVFKTLGSNTIPGGGTLNNVLFQSILSGDIPCDAGSLNQIVTPIIGWETITNASNAFFIGEPAQSDQSAKIYRNNTLALQGSSQAEGMIAAILDVNQGNASSVVFLENTAVGTENIEMVSMVGHSIYVCANPNISNTGIGTNSTVIGTITGTPTTVVPAGSKASSNGNIFQTLEDATIPGGGSIDTTFQALQTGSILVPPATLTTIVTPVVGWVSVTNAAENVITGLISTIAQAMVATKSAGAAYNNGSGINQNAQIIVPFSNQVMTVLFDTPNIIQINVSITVKVTSAIQDPVTTITNAITDYATGKLAGFAGLTVGQNVSSFEISGAVTSLYPSIYVASCFIAYSPTAPTLSAELAIQVYEIAQIPSTNIQVILE